MFQEEQSISFWDDCENGPSLVRLFKEKQTCLGFKYISSFEGRDYRVIRFCKFLMQNNSFFASSA